MLSRRRKRSLQLRYFHSFNPITWSTNLKEGLKIKSTSPGKLSELDSHLTFELFMVFRSSKARQNFDSPPNYTFTYGDFSYKVVRLFFDQLHDITSNEVSLLEALELMVFLNHEGQIDQKSDFETRLYEDLSDQILTKIEDRKELCYIWMFLRSRGPAGRH